MLNSPSGTRQPLLVKSLELSKIAYQTFGARSPQKLVPIHGEIARAFIAGGKNTKGKGVGDNKEVKVQGLFNPKDCDVTLTNSEEVVETVIAIKAVMTNFRQNSNNLFENQLGETANLRLNGLKVAQILLLPIRIPYLNSQGEVLRIEKITDNDIDKYRKMMDAQKIVTPDALYIGFFDIWGTVMMGENLKNTDTSHKISQITDYSKFSTANQEFLRSVDNYDKLITTVAAL